MSNFPFDVSGDERLRQYKEYLARQKESEYYEIKILGGLLKVTPKGVPGKLLLELEQETGEVCLYRHRDEELTKKFKGRRVSKDWVRKFLSANVELSKRLTSEHASSQKAERHREYAAYTFDGAHCRSCGKPLAVCICR